MAMRFGGDSDDEFTEAHEINVTPFIDVMLVLLIIFMVAAPLSTVDLPVNLPTSTARPAPRPDEPVFVTLTADLALHIGETPTDRASIPAALNAATGGDVEARIFLRADRSVTYGDLMVTLDEIRDAGYRHVALVGLEAVEP